METYVIYRDGEEVEVGWFGWKLDQLRRVWNVCKQTDWRHYFQGNGPGEVTYKHFTGFREFQNQLAYNAQWIITVKGGFRRPEGNCYYRSITEYYLESGFEKGLPEYVKDKVRGAEMMIDRYALPDCTCRIGYHRRCPHHFNTRD
jgi:hypothetical protein